METSNLRILCITRFLIHRGEADNTDQGKQLWPIKPTTFSEHPVIKFAQSVESFSLFQITSLPLEPINKELVYLRPYCDLSTGINMTDTYNFFFATSLAAVFSEPTL